MSNKLSAKIIRKKVDDVGFGPNKVKRYSFFVAYQGNETWISAFADERKMAPEVIETLKALGEGDRAEFALEENVGKKDGKTYLNIVGVTREIDVRDDVPAEVQPSGQERKEGQAEAPRVKSGESDTRVRSMALSYAKDWFIAMLGKDAITEKMMIEAMQGNRAEGAMITLAKHFEQYILTGD